MEGCIMEEKHWILKRQVIPDVLEKRQLKALVDTIDSPKIMMATLLGFFLGLRISEVCKLKKKDFDFENKRVKIIDSKFSKDRYVPVMCEGLIPLIKDYFEMVPGESLMCSKGRYGEKMSEKHLGRYSTATLRKVDL